MDITSSQLYIEKILSVTKNSSRIGYTHQKKRHSDCFVYILTGEADYLFGSKRMKAEPGNILYLSRNSEYKIEITHPDYSYYYFDFNFSDSDVIDYDCNVFKSDLVVPLETDFISLYKKWHSGSIAEKTLCMSIVYRIYSEIINSSIYSYISPSRKADIDSALNMIQQNISNPDFNISDITSELGLSDVHFRRLFHKTHSMSPVKYLTFLRLEKAKDYLRNSELQIFEISEKCGFGSSYYFTRVFKADTGYTPSEYRKISISI